MDDLNATRKTETKPLEEIPQSLDRVVPLGEMAPNACPKCSGPMELATVEEQFAVLCKSCQGLLIKGPALAQVIRARRKQYQGPDSVLVPVDPRQLEVRINCPGCALPMEVHPYHGPGNSVIDSCGRCLFTFLDYGELSEIEQAPGPRDD